MDKQKAVDMYLPLTEMTYYILLGMVTKGTYVEIISRVTAITEGEMNLGLGTLYAATQKLLRDGLISEEEEYEQQKVKKYYKLSPVGEYVLEEEYKRLEKLIRNSHVIIKSIKKKV